MPRTRWRGEKGAFPESAMRSRARLLARSHSRKFSPGEQKLARKLVTDDEHGRFRFAAAGQERTRAVEHSLPVAVLNSPSRTLYRILDSAAVYSLARLLAISRKLTESSGPYCLFLCGFRNAPPRLYHRVVRRISFGGEGAKIDFTTFPRGQSANFLRWISFE